VLGSAQVLLYRHTDALLADAAATLARYDGLPVEANLLSIIRRDEDELCHSAVLAWLLTPDESHGLGDAMLRHLLARSSRGVKLALQDILGRKPIIDSLAAEALAGHCVLL
jgi:hypothetical protein